MDLESSRSPDFFLFGCERSGSTLLANLLSSHPNIYTVNDSFVYQIFAKSYLEQSSDGADRLRRRFVRYFRNTLANRSTWLYNLAMNTRAKLRHSKPTAYIPPTDDLPGPDFSVEKLLCTNYIKNLLGHYLQPLPGQKEPTWLAEYAERFDRDGILRTCAAGGWNTRPLLDACFAQCIPYEHRGDSIVGEKTPAHIYYSSWIRHLYPQDKFIVLMRSPLSNIAAIYKRAGKNLSAAIDLYKSTYHPQFYFLYDGSSSLPVRYEQLINNPQATMERIYRYLGVEPAEADGDVPRPTADYIKQTYVGADIDPARDRKLRKLLSTEEQNMIRRECREIMERFFPEDL